MPSLLPPLQSRPEALAPARSAPLRPNDPEAGFAQEFAQETAEVAQGLPSQVAPAAPSPNGDPSSEQSGTRPDSGAAGHLIQLATAGGAGGQPGSQGAPGQPDAPAGQPGIPGAPHRSDGGAPQSLRTALKDTSAAPPSGPSAITEQKQPAGADYSAPRITAERIVARDPAVGRAMQVQAGLVVESLTGSAADPASGTRTVVGDRAVLAGSPAPFTGNAPQGPHDASAGLVRGFNAMVNHSGGVMTMRLEPPELGQVRVQMTIAQGTVTAHFQPATAEAQAILERTLPALRAALEAHGLAAERLTVQSAPQPAPSAREQAHDQPGQERHHQDAGGGESRGRRDGAPQDRQQRTTWHSAPFDLRTASRRTLQGAIR